MAVKDDKICYYESDEVCISFTMFFVLLKVLLTLLTILFYSFIFYGLVLFSPMVELPKM